MSLNRINEQFYNYIDKNTGYIFNFEAGVIGVYGTGICWRLKLIANGCESILACFVTKDDNHHCYFKTTGSKLWDDSDARMAAELMIDRMLNPMVRTTPIIAANDAINTAIKLIAKLSDVDITDDLANDDNIDSLIADIRTRIFNHLTHLGGKFNF